MKMPGAALLVGHVSFRLSDRQSLTARRLPILLATIYLLFLDRTLAHQV